MSLPNCADSTRSFLARRDAHLRWGAERVIALWDEGPLTFVRVRIDADTQEVWEHIARLVVPAQFEFVSRHVATESV